MASGELIIDNKLLKAIDTLEKKLQKVSTSSRTASVDIRNMFAKTTPQGIDTLIKKLQNLEKYYQNIGANESKGMKRIAKQAQNAADEINKVIQSLRATQSTNYGSAMRFSSMAKNLAQYREARENLSRTDSEYNKKLNNINNAILTHRQRITSATRSTEELSRAHRGLFNTSDQLARKLSLVFSVSQVQGYMSKIVAVRKEFELQQKALAAIIGDQDKANELWNQTVALAVKSPFRVKELVTYTKQLAAYRIETDQLHDTTKRLADVSAGLGVDMNRLILAYGQVRAAEYLRGTELRQFTEAGIPMLDELSKHFSNLEGRAISTADVFEMISKRMVSFQDVAKVLENLTNEGGVFFNMQEKQSQTLSGMISNLHDSLDLMMNNIGKMNDDKLKSMVSTVKNLADNWRELAFHIEWIVKSYATWKIANAMFVLGMKNSAKATLWGNSALKLKIGSTIGDVQAMNLQYAKTFGVTKAQYAMGKATMFAQGAIRGLGFAIKAALPFAIIGLLMEMYRIMTKSSREAERLKSELNGIVSSDVANLDKTISGFKDLSSRIESVNKGSDAHREIIRKLNSEYGEYLNFVVTEETTMKNLADAYDDVVKVMREKQALATFEKGMTAISESYGNSLFEAKDDFYELFEGASIKSKTSDFKFLVPSKKEIDDIYALIQQKARELKSSQFDSLKEQSDLIQDIVRGYYGDDFYLSRDFSQSIDLLDILVKKKEQEEKLQDEINSQYKEVLHSREASLELEKLENRYAEKRKKIEEEYSGFEARKELEKAQDEFELEVIDIKVRYNLIGEQEEKEARDKILNWAEGTIADVNNRLKNELSPVFSEEELSNVLFTRHIKDSKTINNYLEDIKKNWEQQNKIIEEQISLKSELGSLDETNENILQTALRKEELYRRAAELLGVELKYTERLSEETRNAINAILPEEYQISLEQAYSGIDKIIADLKKEEAQHLNIIEQINERKKEGLPFNKQELKDAEDAYWWTKKRLDLIDPKTKTPISEGKVNTINAKLEEKYQIGTVDRTKDEVTLLSEANSEKEKAIAYEKQLNAQKEQGHNITKKELDDARKDVEQYTLRWKLLGGTEKETTGGKGRSNSLYDERIKVIDDLNKKYIELNKTLDKSTSMQGAFDAYIDAFADAYEGISWIPKNVREMTPQEFASKVLNFPNEDELVKFLDKLAKEPMKTFEKIKVELAKGEYVLDAKVRLKKDDDKKLIEQVEQMFDEYGISIELEKLNIPKDVAKRLFDVDAISLNELRKKLEEIKPQFVGADQEEEYSKFLKKIDKMEEDALQERLKRYSKFIIDGQSERARLKIEELRELAKLEDDFNNKRIQKPDYELAKSGIQKETKKKLDEVEWDAFKEGGMYIQLFEDLGMVSGKVLDDMLNQLEQLKGSLDSLDPTQLKEILKRMEEIRMEKLSRNPFDGFIESIKKAIPTLKALKRQQQEYNEEVKKLQGIQKGIDNAQINIASAEEKLKGKNLTDEQKWALNEEIKANKEVLELLAQQRKEQEGIVREKKTALDLTWKEAKELKMQTQAVGAMGSQAINAVTGVTDMLKNWGVAVSEELEKALGGIGQVFSSLESIDITKPFSIITGSIGILTGIGNFFASIFGGSDAAKEKQIKKEMEYVEKLEKAYEKLEKAIDDAFSFDVLNVNSDAAIDNLDEQIAKTKQMISLEKQKKDTDDDKIKEWNREIEEMQEQKEEIRQQMASIATGGILDNIRDAASEFTDAWLEAFKETGNGLKGLEDSFDEMVENLITRQATMLITGAYVDKWKKDLDKYINAKDLNLSVEEAKAWVSDVKGDLPALSEGLEQLYEMFKEAGINIGGKDGELSGLQKGIQGVTEDTAQIIESYLNSIRFFVSEKYRILSDFVTSFSNPEAENPIVSQLKIIAKQTSNIYTLLDSLTAPHPTQTGLGLKVVM